MGLLWFRGLGFRGLGFRGVDSGSEGFISGSGLRKVSIVFWFLSYSGPLPFLKPPHKRPRRRASFAIAGSPLPKPIA